MLLYSFKSNFPAKSARATASHSKYGTSRKIDTTSASSKSRDNGLNDTMSNDPVLATERTNVAPIVAVDRFPLGQKQTNNPNKTKKLACNLKVLRP